MKKLAWLAAILLLSGCFTAPVYSQSANELGEPLAVYSQAITLGANQGVRTSASGGVRKTNPNAEAPVAIIPVWTDPNVIGDPVDADQTLLQNTAFAYDLTTRGLCPDECPEGTTVSFAVQTGTLPTGVTLQTGVTCPTATSAYCLKGTPSGTGLSTFTIRATGSCANCTTRDQEFNFTVQAAASDTTAPTVPTNLSGAPTGGTSQTALTFQWNASTDASGIKEYILRHAPTATDCANSTNDSGGIIVTAPTVSYEITGLTAGQSRYLKVRARDNSSNLNVSDFTSCAQGTTAASGGGGGGGGGDPGGTVIFGSGFEAADSETGGTDRAPFSSVTAAGPWKTSLDGCTTLDTQTTEKFDGTRGLRAVLNFSASGSNFRCEVSEQSSTEVMDGTVYCYKWRTKLPAGYATDFEMDILRQWHWQAPCGYLAVVTKDGNWQLRTNASASRCGTVGIPGSTTFATTASTAGSWATFVAEVVWKENATGRFKLWMDGTQEINLNNIVTVPAGQTVTSGVVYSKHGIYKTGTWTQGTGSNVTTRTVYHDGIEERQNPTGGSCAAWAEDP